MALGVGAAEAVAKSTPHNMPPGRNCCCCMLRALCNCQLQWAYLRAFRKGVEAVSGHHTVEQAWLEHTLWVILLGQAEQGIEL